MLRQGVALQSRCLCLPRGGPTRSLRRGRRQKQLHLNMCRSRHCSPFRIRNASAVSSRHPPRARAAHEEEPPAPCLVALKATGLSLYASPTGERGARWPDSVATSGKSIFLVNDTRHRPFIRYGFSRVLKFPSS